VLAKQRLQQFVVFRADKPNVFRLGGKRRGRPWRRRRTRADGPFRAVRAYSFLSHSCSSQAPRTGQEPFSPMGLAQQPYWSRGAVRRSPLRPKVRGVYCCQDRGRISASARDTAGMAGFFQLEKRPRRIFFRHGAFGHRITQVGTHPAFGRRNRGEARAGWLRFPCVKVGEGIQANVNRARA